jgi:hypothetical protein
MYTLCTLEDVTQLQRGSVDAELYPLITQLVRSVTRLFATHCDRMDWDYREAVDYFDSACRLWARHLPIDSTQALTIRTSSTSQWTPDASVVVDASQYVVWPDEGTIVFRIAPPSGLRNVQVSYTGGYLTSDAVGAPEDLRELATMQASFFFQRRSELGLIAHSLEGSAITQEQKLTLLPLVWRHLWRYRRTVFA